MKYYRVPLQQDGGRVSYTGSELDCPLVPEGTIPLSFFQRQIEKNETFLDFHSPVCRMRSSLPEVTALIGAVGRRLQSREFRSIVDR